MLRCFCYDVSAMMFLLRCFCYDVSATMFLLRCFCYDVSAAMFLLRCFCYRCAVIDHTANRVAAGDASCLGALGSICPQFRPVDSALYPLTRLRLRPTRRVECRIIAEGSARSSDAFGTTVKCILARQVVPRLPHGTSLLHGNSPSNLTQRHHRAPAWPPLPGHHPAWRAGFRRRNRLHLRLQIELRQNRFDRHEPRVKGGTRWALPCQSR
jgi:hypothetical protein